MVDMLVDVMDMLVQSGHFVKSFFCGGSGEFIVVMEVYSVWTKA